LHVKFKGINPNVKSKNSSSGIRPSNSKQKFVASNFKFPASNSSFDKANAFDFAGKGEAGVSFIPNLGQIANEDGTKSNDVLFSANSNGVNVFLRNTGVSYVFSNESEITHRVRENLKQLEKSGKINSISKLKKEEELFNKEILKTHRVDMEMLGANKSPVTVNENETEGYINFYNQNCSNGILNVKEYKNITYKDVYKDIDVAYYSNDKNGLKYDFIVRPNANANQIKLHWKYANSVKLNNKGLLEIETEIGVFHESIPKVYQEINGNIIEVDAKYKLLPDENLISNSKTNNNEVIVGFQLGNYNHAYPLIIDPWATYFGGAGDDAFENLAANTNGDVYVCGITSALSVITTPGAHQTVYGGGQGDALVTKFDATGARIWTTYYGGLKRDILVSIAVAPTGDIYTCGRTNSTTGISTVGSHQAAYSGGSFAGSYECILVKMDAAGTRIWATYYGGTDGAEQAADVAVDLAGNIYMCGLTDSNNGIATSGSGEHQSSFGGTLGVDEDGFLAKFNSSGTRLWATYYGGPDPENASAVTTDAAGNVFLAGTIMDGTSSLHVTAGTHQPTYGGGTVDIYLAKFNSAGTRQWGTYIGGSGSEENFGGMSTDSNGNLFIVGYSSSTSAIATAGSFQSSGGGALWDAFVAKFDLTGNRLWGSYIGGSNSDYAYSVEVDQITNEVFVSGDTYSLDFPVTANAAQSSLGGGTAEDGFLTRFTSTGTIMSATYVGGTSPTDDEDCKVALSNCYIYMSGYTGGTYPVTPGAYQTSYGGGLYDGFLIQLYKSSLGVNASLNVSISSNTVTCIGSSITYTPNSSPLDVAGINYSWVFTGGSPAVSTATNPVVTYSTGGTFPVKLVVKTTCSKDSTTMMVTVVNNTLTPVGGTLFCNPNSSTLNVSTTASGVSTYTWSGPGILSGANTQTPTVNLPGNYTVTSTDGTYGCISATVVAVTTNTTLPVITSAISSGSITCSVLTSTLTGTSAGNTMLWNGGALLNATNPATVNAAGNYTVTATNTVTGCASTTVVSVTSNTMLPVITSAASSGSITCSVLTSTLTGTSAGNTLTWNGGALVNATNPATVNAAGNYTVTATNAVTGCASTTVVSVTTNTTLPTVTATSSGSITCSVLTSTLTGTSAGNTLTWNGGALINATNPATVNVAGTYTVTSTNTVTGCSTIATVAVVASGGLPSVSVVAPLQITCSLPTITLTGSSATPSVTYQWTGGAAAATQTVNTAGNYTLTVTNTVTGCASTTVVTVTSNTTLPVITSAINTGSITCTNATSTLTGTSAGNTMLWNGGALVNAANPATVNTAGNYTVTATNASNGCTTTTVVSVTSNTTVPVITSAISSGSITCTNATSTLTGTSAGNTMLWNGGALVNATNPATVNAAGNYTLTATNAVTGCASTTVVSVTTNTTLPIITSATSSGSITCTALTSTLTGTSAGNTMVWNGGALVNAANPATVNSPGTYSVTATNTVTGCSTTTTVGVLASGGLPSVSVVAPLQITCLVPTITLIGSSTTPSVTYQWTGGAAAATQTVNTAGNYTLTVTNTVTGCASTTVVTVTSNTTVPVITSATSSGSITCTALTSTLSGTSAGNVLTWNGGALVNATNPATVNASGNYTLTVSNAANGCTTTTVVSVTSNTTLPVITSASSSGAINCGSGSSTLTAISAGNTLTWNGGALVNATNPSTVSTAGNYTVTSTTAVNGCSTSTVITVIATSPNVTAGAALVLNCSVLNGTINVTSITPGVTYAWSPAVVSGGTTNIATVNTAGTYSCVVTETATACTNTGVVTVTSNTTAPVITSAVSNSVMICGLVNNTTTLTAISAGNALVWNGGVLVNAPNPSIVSSAGIYTVTATNASNGCLSTATVAAISNTVAPIITTVVSSGSITCINNSATLTATSAGNTLVWSGTGIVSPLNPAVVNAAGTYTVMAINPSNGCTVTTTMAVTTNTTLPVITSSSATGTITCTSSSSTLTGISAGNTLTWNGGALANATNPSTVNASGTYTLTATNPSNGCVTNTTVSVNSNITLPTLTAGSPATISCITNTTQVTGSSLTAGVTYSWSGAGITAGATTSSATVNAAGVYSLTVTSSSTGCSNTTTVLVSASPSPTASVSSDVTIFSGASTTLTAGGGGTYVWNNGPTTSSQVVSPKETTNYCVTVTDGAGCTNQKCVLVTVELSCYTNDEYETPTAFTPNNDGMNDQFSLQGWDECTTSFFITIYDRWGEKIFESEDVNFNWDGSYKGKALGSAVFVYYIKADILKVGTINKKGNITLIR
jgi:gliding motility-associated-like protein